jgi:hypothetical protein
MLLAFASYFISVCLIHFEEAEALAPRQGSGPWGGLNLN